MDLTIKEDKKKSKGTKETIRGLGTIKPGFDPSLMQKLMKEGYRSGSFDTLSKYMNKKQRAMLRKKKKKTKKKVLKMEVKPIETKVQEPIFTAPTRFIPVQATSKSNSKDIAETLPLEGDIDSSIDILYGNSKDRLDLSKPAASAEEAKKRADEIRRRIEEQKKKKVKIL